MDMKNTKASLCSELLECVVSDDVSGLKRSLDGVGGGEKCLDLSVVYDALEHATDRSSVQSIKVLLDHVKTSQQLGALELVFKSAAAAAATQDGDEFFWALLDALKTQRASAASVALYCAAEQGQQGWIKPLLSDHGANVNSVNAGFGLTALHAAARNGHTSCVTTLLAHGAHATAQDSNLWTPLHYATGNSHTECVGVLLKHGADINSKADNGDTPLHLTAMFGHVDYFEQLVHSGAKTTLRNNDNMTALEAAKQSTRAEMQLIVDEYNQRSVWAKWGWFKALKRRLGILESSQKANAHTKATTYKS